jgi:dTDP-4-dehydrorhamnose reductase
MCWSEGTFRHDNIPHLLGILRGLHYQIRQARGKLTHVVALDCAQMGMAWLGRVREAVRDLRPGLTVNAAIYIAVEEPSACQEFSMHINADASALPAEEARKIGTMMIHYLTD